MTSIHTLKTFIDESQWNNAINLIRSDPSICRKRYTVLYVTEGNEISDVLPIHHACSRIDAPMQLITTMISAYPDSIQQVEFKSRRTCVHIAILKCLPDTIISYLLEVYPDVTKVQDRYGRVPLHYACSNLRSFDLIKQIITPFPQCILAPDWKMWTSLHVALTKNTNPDIIQYIITQCPESVLLRTRSGATPLEIMMDADADNHNGMMPHENKVKISKMLLMKIDELNDRPESRNFINAERKPMTPVQMNPYGIV